jgi:hypothetical protein
MALERKYQTLVPYYNSMDCSISKLPARYTQHNYITLEPENGILTIILRTEANFQRSLQKHIPK